MPPPLYAWTTRVTNAFPVLSVCQARVLALYSFGLVLAQTCGLSTVAAILAELLAHTTNAVRQRLREWYQDAATKAGTFRTELDPTICFGPLLTWVLRDWTTRHLALALDPTYLGERFIVLTVAVLYRGCGVPVAWQVIPADQQGSWTPHWEALLTTLAARVGADWTVTVLSDRGLESQALFQAIVALGWHPLMRIKQAAYFQPDGWHRPYRATALVPHVGSRWRGRGHAYKGQPLACTLLAYWGPDYDEPWLILTDVAPDQADAVWYGWRCWIEQTFKLIKRGGWQWQKTRMTDATRVARLWVVVAVATLWLLEVGGVAETQIPLATVVVDVLPRPGRRVRGIFRRGRTLLLSQWLSPRRAERPARFVPEAWPAVPEWHNELLEQELEDST